MIQSAPVLRLTYLVRFPAKADAPAGWYEMIDDATEASRVIADIAGGQYGDGPESVVVLAPDGGWSDVTDIVARGVLSAAIDRWSDGPLVLMPQWLEEWLEGILGCEAIARTLADHASEWHNAATPRAGATI